MLDDELDHIIREAAEKHHPAYDDKAWDKMEMQLNRHLPQKKERKRWIFFLLFFLLVGGFAFIAVNYLDQDKKPVAGNQPAGAGPETNGPGNDGSPEKNVLPPGETGTQTGQGNNTGTIPGTGNNQPGNTNAGGKIGNAIPSDNAGPGANTAIHDDNSAGNNSSYLSKNRKTSKQKNGKTNVSVVNGDAGEDPAGKDVGVSPKNKSPRGKTEGKMSVNITAPIADGNENLADNKPATKNKEVVQGEITKAEPANEPGKKTRPATPISTMATTGKPVKKPTDKKTKKSPFSNFGITASMGPDLSFVDLKHKGKTTFTYGGGISYDFGKRLNLRTGFYFSKKIYTASPGQYHTPGGNYPYLTGVDADCKVYVIPLSVSYSFGHRKKHNWFGGVGVSSFIMKSEDYVYNYKTPAGQTYTYYHEVKNENKHYFSVLNLSAGYNYNVSKRVSVMAEPYVQLPLSGVGLGKIKLNSAGVLFTVKVKPFGKNK